ncbi:MAG: hypothetical protein IBX43_10815 [Campylobacterales bacterium]|nr:hypothetical protein [Campylobacterales bacterium]
MKINSRKIVLSSLAVAALAFTGCGGGGGGDTTTPPVVIDGPTDTNITTLFGGAGAAQIQAIYEANSGSFAGLKAHPIRTQAQINTANSAVVLTGEITANTTLTKDTLYRIQGTVKVRNNAILTIEPGTVIFGSEGEDVLIILKGSKIIADGTADEPIIFTSETALLDPAKADVGQWGGLTLLGAAPTNQADPHYEIDESDADFAYGGGAGAGSGNADDNSGILRHLYVLNSGETIGTDLEINGLSLCGVGAGTVVEDIYVENSSDDCIEIWGGTVNVTNATMINCQDDSFDLDFGWSGTATNIVVQQTEAGSHAGFEISSGGSTPMTSGKIVNFIINKVAGTDEGGIYIKDDTTAVQYINGYVKTYGTDAAINVRKEMLSEQENATKFKEVLVEAETKYGGAGAAQIQAIYEANSGSFASLKAHPIRTQAQLDAAELLTGNIETSITLDKTKLYRILGTTKVKSGATITIPAGTVIFGVEGEDVLVFTKGTKIEAAGTADEPIIFTSETALLNPANADVGQWGGLTLLGQAPTNQPSPRYEIDESDVDFDFGGSDANDSSGTLKNIYVLNSGETIGTDLEINGLSLCGVGAGTVVEDIYVENSSDDCIEIWGGTVNVTNATMINCQDDSFDLDFGWSGTATNIVVQQTEAGSHAGFEISSGGASPMTSGKIVNFIINKVPGADEGGIYIKDDTTAVQYINGYVKTYGTDAAINVRKEMTTEQQNATKFKEVIIVNQ